MGSFLSKSILFKKCCDLLRMKKKMRNISLDVVIKTAKGEFYTGEVTSILKFKSRKNLTSIKKFGNLTWKVGNKITDKKSARDLLGTDVEMNLFMPPIEYFKML